MAAIRVLVADDSLTVRKYLVEVLRAEPGFEVVGEAEDGRRATELCETLRPDVVSLDMMMPEMSGLAATEYIMAYCPTPILIVSSSRNRGEVFNTYEALSAGAVDVLDKAEALADERWQAEYRRALETVSRIRVITHPRARLAGRRRSRQVVEAIGASSSFRCVAIGGSTGAPGAVSQLLRDLPAGFPLPILLVIHISEPFALSLTEWLDTVSPIPVRNAADGQPLPAPGEAQVIMAPPNRHLVLRDGRLWTTTGPERHHCRPSVDVLFESLAGEIGSSVIACLLTGMGRDGASGLLAIRRRGGVTVAQNEESSVVFGMPGAAIALGAARHVLALSDIAPALRELAQQPGRTVAP
jgi:two-component system chemotaxis response regulator CheB